MRTMVSAPNWVGDVVMALPVLEALSASERDLVVLARPHLEPLLRLFPSVKEIVCRGETSAETIAAIRASNCQEAVILPNSFRSAWLPYKAGIPYRWGYRGDLRSLLLNPPVPRPPRRRRHPQPQVEDYRQLLTALGVAEPASWTPTLKLPRHYLAQGRERLARAGIELEGQPLIGLFPGAEFGPSKRWPWRYFADLARQLRRSLPAIRQVIVAGPKEVWLAVRVYEESGKTNPVVGPDLDLAQLAGVMAHFDLLITNDSGPMHLAAALGVPCLALFGPTDPRRTAPAGPEHRVLYTNRWCSPCFRRRCPLLHHACLREIGVARARESALALLEQFTSGV
ncbi:MAG TPA: lipopolysaccharide heptosyltransferase II [Thermoanaerobaculia bacterium]|nr:lipopolysaccharide heptosyltransferase II [Thermoanaerobaculia bacterium]